MKLDKFISNINTLSKKHREDFTNVISFVLLNCIITINISIYIDNINLI